MTNFCIVWLTSTYNTCNLSLYLASFDKLLLNYGLLDHRLCCSEWSWKLEDIRWEQWLASGSVPFLLMLAYSNHKAYRDYVANLILSSSCCNRDLEAQPLVDSENNQPKEKGRKIPAFFAAFFKAIVMSGSAVNLVRSWAGEGIKLKIAVGLVCFSGSLSTQYAVFTYSDKANKKIPDTGRCSNVGEAAMTILAFILTLVYNISNTVLYFNASDYFLFSIFSAVDYDYSIFPKDLASASHLAFYLFSFCLFFNTYQAYLPKVNKLLSVSSGLSDCSQLLNKVIGFLSAMYKAIVNATALFRLIALIFFSISTDRYAIAGTVATVCIPGSIATQYAMWKVSTPDRRMRSNTAMLNVNDQEEKSQETQRPSTFCDRLRKAFCCGWKMTST